MWKTAFSKLGPVKINPQLGKNDLKKDESELSLKVRTTDIATHTHTQKKKKKKRKKDRQTDRLTYRQ